MVVAVARCCASTDDFFNYVTSIVNTVSVSCKIKDRLLQKQHDVLVPLGSGSTAGRGMAVAEGRREAGQAAACSMVTTWWRFWPWRRRRLNLIRRQGSITYDGDALGDVAVNAAAAAAVARRRVLVFALGVDAAGVLIE